MRKPRKLIDGAWYHVTVRSNHREMLLDRCEIRDLFLHFVCRAKKRYRFSLANFCVMGNHVHLQIQPGKGESLSAIMRWILGNFARAYNKRRGWTGHFWGDRYHSRILDGFRQAAIAFGYIDDNPVKAGLVAVACLWRHGGAWHAWKRDPSLLDPGLAWAGILASIRPVAPALSPPIVAQAPRGTVTA